MKKKSFRVIMSMLSFGVVYMLSACFKPYEIDDTIVINPTIKQTDDFLKVDRAVKETTTTIEITTEQETESEEITVELETEESTNEIDITQEEITDESKVVETAQKMTNSIEDIGKKTFIPTAQSSPAPYKNPNILKEELTAVVENKGWTYGKSPVSWIYVRPNTKIVSNYRPNGSVKYAVKSEATSGEYGCYLPIFSSTNNVDEYYEGRFYCYDDYSKSTPDGFRFINGLEDFKIEGIKVIDILKYKYPDLMELKKGLYFNVDQYINIVYVEDLYNILNNK